MSIVVHLPDQELAALKQFTHLENDAEAVVTAAREFLRLSRLRELKGVCGKVEFDSNWQQYEGMELSEGMFPSATDSAK